MGIQVCKRLMSDTVSWFFRVGLKSWSSINTKLSCSVTLHTYKWTRWNDCEKMFCLPKGFRCYTRSTRSRLILPLPLQKTSVTFCSARTHSPLSDWHLIPLCADNSSFLAGLLISEQPTKRCFMTAETREHSRNKQHC